MQSDEQINIDNFASLDLVVTELGTARRELQQLKAERDQSVAEAQQTNAKQIKSCKAYVDRLEKTVELGYLNCRRLGTINNPQGRTHKMTAGTLQVRSSTTLSAGSETLDLAVKKKVRSIYQTSRKLIAAAFKQLDPSVRDELGIVETTREVVTCKTK